MDQLRAMRVFATVVEAGSFVRAAERLDIAPAVATRQIAELESALGARLLNRTTRRIALTQAGERYLERVQRILADVEEAAATVGSDTADPRGVVRLLAPAAFAAHQLARRLPELRRRYPELLIELTVQNAVHGVDDGHDITLLMLPEPLTGGNFVARLLAHSEMIVCASPAYLDRHTRPTHPEQLTGHEWLLPFSPDGRRQSTFEPSAQVVAAGRVPKPVTLEQPPMSLATAHWDTLHGAALADMGITALPSFVADGSLRDGRLEHVLPQWRVLAMQLYAAVPTRRHLPARTRVVFDYLVAAFGGVARDPWLRATP